MSITLSDHRPRTKTLPALYRLHCGSQKLHNQFKVMKLEKGPARFELRGMTIIAHDYFPDLQVTNEEKLCVFLSYCV